MIEKIGRSGVELHQIRRNVGVDGSDTTPRGKPQNAYLDDRRKAKGSGDVGFNANRPFSCGFGPGTMTKVDESIPKLSAREKAILIGIDEGKEAMLPNTDKVAQGLSIKGLVMWSAQKQRWLTMADGRRVAELIR